ncbi:MAG: hypothetical protein ACRCTZ_01230 [Sarcina sp.]
MCMQGKCEKLEFEMLKNECDYCGVIDLVAGIKGCNTDFIDMVKVAEYMMNDKSLDEILDIKLIEEVVLC